MERGDCRAGSTPEFASVASPVASTASAAVVVDVADESFGCDPGAAVSPVDALDLSVVGDLDAAPLAGAFAASAFGVGALGFLGSLLGAALGDCASAAGVVCAKATEEAARISGPAAKSATTEALGMANDPAVSDPLSGRASGFARGPNKRQGRGRQAQPIY